MLAEIEQVKNNTISNEENIHVTFKKYVKQKIQI